MVEKPYEWTKGATLEEHSKRKHKILREYFARYLEVRCQLPQQSRFRVAIIEGFAGGGRYACGSLGSPIIFLQELQKAANSFNIARAANGMSPIELECLLLLNDSNRDAIQQLKEVLQPLLAATRDVAPSLHLHVDISCQRFELAYPRIKALLDQGRYRNVLFNLDQCGHSKVNRATLVDIMSSYISAEVFYTFAIGSLLAFLQKSNRGLLNSQLSYLNLDADRLHQLDGLMNKRTWLGTAERIVASAFDGCARYVSPFSINNPDGWQYWFIHFANFYRARQEYNNVLHNNSSMQAHFGRSGLDMLSFDPSHSQNELYLFEDSDREKARQQLSNDIPRLVNDFGDAVEIHSFYESVYKMTPAHADDIHQAIFQNTELEVITPSGGERRKANTIGPEDTLRLKSQPTFFPMFLNNKDKLK